MSTSDRDIEKRRKHLEALATQGDVAGLREHAAELHPSDLADLVELLTEAQQIELLSELPTELASDTLAEMEEGEERGDLLAALTPRRALSYSVSCPTTTPSTSSVSSSRTSRARSSRRYPRMRRVSSKGCSSTTKRPPAGS